MKVEINDDFCFVRKDVHIPVSDGNHIVASFFYNVTEDELNNTGTNFSQGPEKPSKIDVNCAPCLIYCHSHNGTRVEGRFLREFCGKNRYCLCLFDFLGHGQSQGEYSSLGYFEQFQLERLIEYLRCNFNVGPIGLWGRSMGAVTCILYAANNSFNVTAMVLFHLNSRFATALLLH
jgi:pimeloyl-ACP methyl ester carboxylesterase